MGPTSTNCGSSGSSGADVQPITEPLTMSRFVGTWKGPWPSASLIDDPDLRGDMTLAVDETGNVTGQITNTKTGQSGILSGAIIISDNVAHANLTTTFADQSQSSNFGIYLRQYGDQHPELLEGGLYVPNTVIVPVDMPPGERPPIPDWPNVGFSLSRQ